LTSSSIDFQVFYHAGLDTLQGRNPYLATHPGVMPFLYPPNVLPLFCGLASLDYQTSRAIWIGLNVAFSLSLAPLAWIALGMQDPSWPSLRPEVRGALAAFVPMTTAAALTIDVGQLSLWTAVAAFLALAAQGLRRPVIAGLCLSLALFKATTAIPLFVLFMRRSDRASWGVLVALSLFLSLIPRPSTNPIEDLKTASKRIAENARAGDINDYSLANEYSYSIIGIDHTLSRLGLGHRRTVGLMQLGILAMICCWLAWEVLWARNLGRSVHCSLVAIVAVLFFYHRLYDTVLLVLPLTYAIGRADSTRGAIRLRYLAAILLLMVPLSASSTVMKEIHSKIKMIPLFDAFYERLVLTLPTWSILASGAILVWASYAELKNLSAEFHGG